MEKEKQICYVCGVVLDRGIHEFEGKLFCDTCFDEKTRVCDNCGERLWADEAEGDSECTLCYDCYERSYTTCEDCRRLIHNDNAYYLDDYDDNPYCLSCYEKKKDEPIKSYGYKPEPVFYGSGNLFMGVELEVDKGGEYDENANRLLNIANECDDRIYCKHDGSMLIK